MVQKKFTTTRYNDQVWLLTLTFDLLRHALKKLKGKGFRDFMETMRLPEKARLDKLLAVIARMPSDETPFTADEATARHRKKLSKNLPITRSLKWAEYKGQALLGLNSSELITRVALFEACLKEIHRRTLHANEKLLIRSKPNRPITLKNIFQGGFERFKLAEIDRQVREMDRLTTKEKAKFFRHLLKLPWHNDFDAERALVKRIGELINLRHELVHSEHSPHVADKDIADARDLLKRVPAHCIFTAEREYPAHFTLPTS